MKKRFGVVATIVAAASFFSLITASVAWFEARTDVDFGTGHGSTAAAYFASGSGKSEAEAYVISSPIHMYNLAWLQYLGRFNTKVSPTYFKLKNDIDMSGLNSALPPIGTEDNPFIGVFDGQGYTISNLTVSNDINQITKHPSTVQALQGVSVVGFFGIVGNPQPIGIQRGDTDLDYTELQVFDKLNLHHFNLQNVVVKSTTAQTLMGIVAGYVNGHDGTVHDIGVMNGSLQAAQGATCLQHFADDDTEDPARPISKFSLIGETEDTEWKEAYDDSGTGSGDGPGHETGFGGSIDMKTLCRRVDYMISKYQNGKSISAGYDYVLDYDSFGLNFYATNMSSLDNYEFYWKSAVSGSYSSYIYFKDNNCLPINVDLENMGLTTDTEQTVTVTVNNSAKTWHINSYYLNNSTTSEIVKSSNTGYIVGGSDSSDSGLKNGTVRLRINSVREIQRSLGNVLSVSTNPTTTYSDEKLKMLTYDPSISNYVVIKDKINKNATTSSDFTSKGYPLKDYSSDLNLQRYENVRSNLTTMLDGSKIIYGIGFMKAIDTSASADKKYKTFNRSLYLNGQSLSSYQFVKNAINFSLANDGFLTMVTGSYYNSYDATSTTAYQQLPSIYKLTRDASGNISSMTLVENVYETSTGYQINGSSGTKVFDQAWYSKLPLARSAYYTEIHLPAGDYAMGCPKTGYNSGYLIYLDIGANGNGSGGSGTTQEYNLKNVRYVHSLTETLPNSPTYLDILFEITTAAGATGTVAIYFARQSPALLYYHKTNNVDLRVFIATATNIEKSTSAIWDA